MLQQTRSGVCFLAVLVTAIALGAGCTPDEEQFIRDAANMVIQDAMTRVINLAAGIGRQSIAAFFF